MNTTNVESIFAEKNPNFTVNDFVKIINSMPENIIPIIYKRVIHQKYDLNWTYQEIADFLNVSNSLVRQKVEKCIHLLLTDYLFLVQENITMDELIKNHLTGDVPIKCLPLKTRFKNALVAVGIDTVEQLLAALDHSFNSSLRLPVDITGINGLGAYGVKDVVDFVSKVGLLSRKDIDSHILSFAYCERK